MFWVPSDSYRSSGRVAAPMPASFAASPIVLRPTPRQREAGAASGGDLGLTSAYCSSLRGSSQLPGPSIVDAVCRCSRTSRSAVLEFRSGPLRQRVTSTERFTAKLDSDSSKRFDLAAAAKRVRPGCAGEARNFRSVCAR